MVFHRDVMYLIDGEEVYNQINRNDEEVNMPFIPTVQNNNMISDYMVIIFFIGITIDNYNDPATDKFPSHKKGQQGR